MDPEAELFLKDEFFESHSTALLEIYAMSLSLKGDVYQEKKKKWIKLFEDTIKQFKLDPENNIFLKILKKSESKETGSCVTAIEEESPPEDTNSASIAVARKGALQINNPYVYTVTQTGDPQIEDEPISYVLSQNRREIYQPIFYVPAQEQAKQEQPEPVVAQNNRDQPDRTKPLDIVVEEGPSLEMPAPLCLTSYKTNKRIITEKLDEMKKTAIFRPCAELSIDKVDELQALARSIEINESKFEGTKTLAKQILHVPLKNIFCNHAYDCKTIQMMVRNHKYVKLRCPYYGCQNLLEMNEDILISDDRTPKEEGNVIQENNGEDSEQLVGDENETEDQSKIVTRNNILLLWEAAGSIEGMPQPENLKKSEEVEPATDENNCEKKRKSKTDEETNKGSSDDEGVDHKEIWWQRHIKTLEKRKERKKREKEKKKKERKKKKKNTTCV